MLTIVTVDRPAYEIQAATWTQAAELIPQVWPKRRRR
jgi:hypothetical protein